MFIPTYNSLFKQLCRRGGGLTVLPEKTKTQRGQIKGGRLHSGKVTVLGFMSLSVCLQGLCSSLPLYRLLHFVKAMELFFQIIAPNGSLVHKVTVVSMRWNTGPGRQTCNDRGWSYLHIVPKEVAPVFVSQFFIGQQWKHEVLWCSEWAVLSHARDSC